MRRCIGKVGPSGKQSKKGLTVKFFFQIRHRQKVAEVDALYQGGLLTANGLGSFCYTSPEGRRSYAKIAPIEHKHDRQVGVAIRFFSFSKLRCLKFFFKRPPKLSYIIVFLS